MTVQKKALIPILLLLILLMVVACGAPYSNPPTDFQDSDLIGTWEARYMEWGTDRLVLKADGTFRQVYQDHTEEGYVYETPWNEWWVERLADGRVQVHLKGARYYLAGLRIAEQDGMLLDHSADYPRAFHDPIADEPLYMIEELVLNVRSDSSGEILLHHMWVSSDRGFAITGGESEVFRRIQTP
jgi:hypothetical protein